MTPLDIWAQKWNVPPHALAELSAALYTEAAPLLPPPRPAPKNEGDVVDRARSAASARGWRLFRNNVGATYDDRGNFIRYGLANDSARLNKAVKSSDLIGIRPLEITALHIGRVVGQFVAVECKAPGWTFPKSGGNERERAQAKFLRIVEALGGHAVFSSTGGVE